MGEAAGRAEVAQAEAAAAQVSQQVEIGHKQINALIDLRNTMRDDLKTLGEKTKIANDWSNELKALGGEKPEALIASGTGRGAAGAGAGCWPAGTSAA